MTTFYSPLGVKSAAKTFQTMTQKNALKNNQAINFITFTLMKVVINLLSLNGNKLFE